MKCVDRGNNEKFIKRLKEVFVPYYEDVLSRNYETLYIIDKNETLESILIKNNFNFFCGLRRKTLRGFVPPYAA